MEIKKDTSNLVIDVVCTKVVWILRMLYEFTIISFGVSILNGFWYDQRSLCAQYLDLLLKVGRTLLTTSKVVVPCRIDISIGTWL
jgi:hypothetical protein